MKQYLMPSYGEIMKHALTCKAIGAEVCSSVWCEFVLVKVNMNQLGVILYLNMYVCKFEPIQHVFRQKAFCKESILFHSYTLFYSLQRGQGIFIAINYTHVFSGDPKIENSFVVSGFVGKDASIHQFSTASVARFSLAISRTEKNGEETNRTSAFMNVEAWRKNENTSSFDRLVKGTLLTVEGYFKPEEWQDADGVKHNRVVLVATKFYEAVEKEETPAPQESKTKKGK